MVVLLGVGFIIGALAILAVETVGLLLLIRRINEKVAQQEHKVGQASESSPIHYDPSFHNKQAMAFFFSLLCHHFFE